MDKEIKEPKCDTCGDTGEVPKPMPTEPHPCNYVNFKRAERTIPCPDCQQPKDSPNINPAETISEYPESMSSDQQPSSYETRTIENTYICPCGNIFVEDDDYDTLGSEIVCCPDCGNEKFQTIKARLDTSEQQRKDLLEALEQIRDLETECCQRCEGNGRLYADGKGHLVSENVDTIPCGNCGGSGRILPENAQDIAEAAIAETGKGS